jgi:Ca2+:H+ antiporter
MSSTDQTLTAAAKHKPGLPVWTMAAPALGLAVLGASALGFSAPIALVALGLGACVFASVHHAETVAHRVGEPMGTLVLALAVTLIEVALIVSLMLSGGDQATALARDTVFAAIMIILTGIIGLCLLLGGLKFRAQQFALDGVSAALAALAAIAVLTLVYPNYTVSTPGPYYSSSQLGFIAIVSVVVYGGFLFAQTITHRSLFLDPDGSERSSERSGEPSVAAADVPGNGLAAASTGLMLICLVAVVLLAKKLAPSLEAAVAALGAPDAVVGIIIAAIVLLPEGLSAVRAARQDRLQTSLNLALGSALASIGLTIPAVALVSLISGIPLALGIDGRSSVLLVLALFVTTLALRTGRTILLHGIVLLVLFAVYLFTSVVP